MVDEDGLLAGETIKIPLTVPDDCEMGAGGARKACKDCTCGRAEGQMVDKVELTQDMLDNPGSAGGCGSVSIHLYHINDILYIYMYSITFTYVNDSSQTYQMVSTYIIYNII
jgi:hypothetical protein